MDFSNLEGGEDVFAFSLWLKGGTVMHDLCIRVYMDLDNMMNSLIILCVCVYVCVYVCAEIVCRIFHGLC